MPADQPLAGPDVRHTAHIRLSGIVKTYGSKRVLDDVSIDIEPGTVHALIGANGAGKSTLGNIVAGAVRPTAGEILLDEQPVHWSTPREARRAGVALIAQELALVPHLSVMENVFLGLPPARWGVVSHRRLQQRYRDLVDRWGFDPGRDKLIKDLRLADQQMVEILRAVASGARLIVMDEPTSSLTDVEIEPLKRMIRELRSDGVTIVYVSHFLDDILELSDRITVMRDGRHIHTVEGKDETEETLMQAMFGDAVAAEHIQKHPKPDAEPVLEVRGLSREGALNDINFTIHAGEIVGLAGLVGSGRSELARALFGADPIDTGTVSIDGRQIRLRTPADAIKAGIAFVPESRKEDGLFLEMPIPPNVTVSHIRTIASKLGLIRFGEEREAARTAIQDYAIAASSSSVRVGGLSGGNQQKVLFAKWLFRAPRVLLLDEPTRGVDVNARAAIHRLVVKLAEDGVAVLVISSELEEVLALAHRTLVIAEGSLVSEFGLDPPLNDVMEAAFAAGRKETDAT